MASPLYTSLDTSTREIRLLLVQPADMSDRKRIVEASLAVRRLDDAVHYVALSYTWGDPEPTCPILLDGTVFHVRKNLHDALVQYRPYTGVLSLWVDAICIDQNHMSERESQVSIMCDIYRKAERVLAWLGVDSLDINAEQSFAFLCQLADQELENLNEDHYYAQIARTKTIERIQRAVSNPAYAIAWLKIANLFASRWFSRMWIIQEVVMSTEAYVCCGSYGTPWKTLFLAAKFIEKYASYMMLAMLKIASGTRLAAELPNKMNNLSSSAHNVAEIGRLKNVRSELVLPPNNQREYYLPKSVYQVVAHYSNFDVTEPRDRVYSLLGILAEYRGRLWQTTVSYSIPLADLYWQMFKEQIQVTKRLNFLSDAIGVFKPHSISSWMPYWCHSDRYHGKRACSIDALALAPEITYKATSNTFPFCYFSPRLKALYVAGFVCGVVSRVGDVCEDLNSPDQQDYQYESITKWIAMLEIQDVLGDSLPYKLNVNTNKPSEKEIRAYTFVSAVSMIDKVHERTQEQLWDLYESKVQAHEVSPSIGATSVDNYMSARQSEAILHRRLFFTSSGSFGLGPSTTAPGDILVFIYGCNVPMLLRPMHATKLWRVVGEVWWPYNMNGEMLDSDMYAARNAVGSFDQFFALV